MQETKVNINNNENDQVNAHEHEHGEACEHEGKQYSDYEIALKMYQAEVDKPWPDMQTDIDLLHDIIAAHEALKNPPEANSDTPNAKTAEDRIVLPVLFKKSEDGYNIEMPEWLYDALFHFKEKYGEEMGDFMLEKTLSKVWHKMVPLQPLNLQTTK